MTDLFLSPVGDDWIDLFEDTVKSPLSIPDDAPDELSPKSSVRIWGTTVGEGSKKRTTFESMDSGDLVLFLHGGEFIGSGRVGETFENADLGAWIWDSPQSRFVYTVNDYQEISIPRSEVWDVLGYSPNYPLYGFSRASDDAISTLLQTYNSVEEAFQDLRDDGVSGDSPDPDQTSERPEDEIEKEVREHTEIQWYLIQLGLEHGYDVYVATNDQNLTYEGQRLGKDCVDSLSLTGFSDAAMRLIEYVDVIWLNDDYIEKMFEVESTTSIYSGILRMTDFVVKVPNLAVDMHIVAPAEDEEQARRQMTRPTFQHVMDRAQHCSLSYLSFAEVRNKSELVEQAGPLQAVF
jgi:hypothetical protein